MTHENLPSSTGELNHVTAGDYFGSVLKNSAVVFDVDEAISDELKKIGRIIGGIEEALPMSNFRHITPRIAEEWVDPLSKELGACHPTFTSLELLPVTDEVEKTLHTDSTITQGLTILAPFSGPDAVFVHANSPKKLNYETAALLVDTEHDSVAAFLYGVGRAVLLRHKIIEGEKFYPSRFHDGFGLGTRNVIAIDLHTETSPGTLIG